MIVLLTGGSSGIGAAAARLLAEAGMKVYAGSRRGTVETPMEGIVPVKLDVNDKDSLDKAVAGIVAAEGRLDAVICNAGNGIYGPVEFTSEEDARYQMETCFFGTLKTIQACLPVFRRQNSGRIITVTSVMGVLQLPFQTFYSAAKAATLALTDGLAMELKGTGIQCCSILPGDVSTGFTAARRFSACPEGADNPYRAAMDVNLKKIEKDELSGMQPELIGKAILGQLRRRRMAARVTPRIDYKAVGLAVRLLPARAKIDLISSIYQ